MSAPPPHLAGDRHAKLPSWGAMLLFAGGAFLLVEMLAFSATRQNDVEAARSVTRVEQALAATGAAMGATVRDYAIWDEAFEKVGAGDVDADWADKNIGVWLHRNVGIAQSLLVDEQGGVAYAAVDGARADGAQVATADLMPVVRQALAKAGEEAPEVTTLLRLQGGPFLVTASVVRPEDNAAPPVAPRVLVLARPMAGALVEKLAETVALPTLALASRDLAGRTVVALPLRGPEGEAIGLLTWSPHRPGSEFLGLALPVTVSVFSVVAAAGLGLWIQLNNAYGEITASDMRQRVFLSASPDLWFRLGRDGRLLDYVGPPAGFDGVEPVPGQNLKDILPSVVTEMVTQSLLRVLAVGRGDSLQFAVGERWFDASLVRLNLDEAVFTARDITQRHKAEQQLLQLAHYDSLTGLPNRTLALDRVEQAILRAERENESVGVMLIDLDDFKDVNDTLGHPAGDELLVELGRRLARSLRQSDTVGRMGGDEFLMVAPGLRGTEDIDAVAAKILAVFDDPVRIGEKELFMAASIGVCCYPADGRSVHELIKNADTALYSAKNDGSRFQRFRPAMDEELRERLVIEQRLRHALAAGEMELHYQPQLNLRTGRVDGAEALLRWHPHGMAPIGPDKFIAIAESSGLIVEIGRWLLHTACRAGAEWRRRHGDEFRIAINLSARQFSGNDIVADVQAALVASGLPPQAVELEITEGLLIGYEHIHTLRQLKAMGLRLAIDDFGTGFSSLSYIRDYPFDTLKVDRSFVRDLLSDERCGALTRNIVSMAHSLGLDTVAEGVEHAEELEFLRRCECQHVQGFLIARPLPVAEFDAFMTLTAPLAAQMKQIA